MSTFSDRTRQRLEQAGWYVGRSIDISRIVEALESKGYEVFPAARNLFHEFGGLYVKYPDRNHVGFLRELRFDIFRGPMKGISDNWSEADRRRFESYAGEPFCVVGSDTSDYLVLMMGKSGKMYGSKYGDVSDMVQLGESAYEAIENLLGRDDIAYYKFLAPYHEDRLREILSTARVIASAGHDRKPYFLKDDLDTERFLRQVGYKVYTVDPSVEEFDGFPTYPRLLAVPEPIDIVVWHNYEVLEQVVDEAIVVGAKAIFPSWNTGVNPSPRKKAQDAGIEYIEGIGIKQAYRRVMIPIK